MSGADEKAPDYAGHSAAHTPGPWVINGTAICGQEPQLPWRERDEYPDGTFMVAESVFNVANARLIAAAPDMLVALKLIAASPNAHPANLARMAEEAITKAEGRT